MIVLDKCYWGLLVGITVYLNFLTFIYMKIFSDNRRSKTSIHQNNNIQFDLQNPDFSSAHSKSENVKTILNQVTGHYFLRWKVINISFRHSSYWQLLCSICSRWQCNSDEIFWSRSQGSPHHRYNRGEIQLWERVETIKIKKSEWVIYLTHSALMKTQT